MASGGVPPLHVSAWPPRSLRCWRALFFPFAAAGGELPISFSSSIAGPHLLAESAKACLFLLLRFPDGPAPASPPCFFFGTKLIWPTPGLPSRAGTDRRALWALSADLPQAIGVFFFLIYPLFLLLRCLCFFFPKPEAPLTRPIVFFFPMDKAGKGLFLDRSDRSQGRASGGIEPSGRGARLKKGKSRSSFRGQSRCCLFVLLDARRSPNSSFRAGGLHT